MIMFWNGLKPSDGGYVFVDIVLNILPPLLFGTTAASDHLTRRRPQRHFGAYLYTH